MGYEFTPHRAGSRQNTTERRWAIVEEVQRNQRLSVADLSQQFGVSEATIRRDLASLERRGLLQRVHGGAQAVSLAEQAFLFDARLLPNTGVKRAIVRIIELYRGKLLDMAEARRWFREAIRSMPPGQWREYLEREISSAAMLDEDAGEGLVASVRGSGS